MGVKIGLDAELMFSADGQSYARASSLVHNSLSASFGVDGCSATAELRPTPSEDPVEVVNTLQNIMQRTANQRPELFRHKWFGGSWFDGYTMGAHIHFGTGHSPSTKEIDYLDTFLSPIVQVLDSVDCVRQRTDRGYGRLSAWRGKVYGYEYRTLPSFLPDKKLTLAILKVAKAIVEHVREGEETEIERKKFSSYRLRDRQKQSMNRGDMSAVVKTLSKKKNFISKIIFKGVKDNDITYLFECVNKAIKGEYSLNKVDIKEAWGIVQRTPRTVRPVVQTTFREIWEREITVCNTLPQTTA
jgi:hypothetical protein